MKREDRIYQIGSRYKAYPLDGTPQWFDTYIQADEWLVLEDEKEMENKPRIFHDEYLQLKRR